MHSPWPRRIGRHRFSPSSSRGPRLACRPHSGHASRRAPFGKPRVLLQGLCRRTPCLQVSGMKVCGCHRGGSGPVDCRSRRPLQEGICRRSGRRSRSRRPCPSRFGKSTLFLRPFAMVVIHDMPHVAISILEKNIGYLERQSRLRHGPRSSSLVGRMQPRRAYRGKTSQARVGSPHTSV